MVRKVEVQVFPQTTEPPRYRTYSLWRIAIVLLAVFLAGVGFRAFEPLSILRRWTDVSLFKLYAQNKNMQKALVQMDEKVEAAQDRLAESDSLRAQVIQTAGLEAVLQKAPLVDSTEEPMPFGSIGPARNMNRIRTAHRELRALLDHLESNSGYANSLPLLHPLRHHQMITARFSIIHDQNTGNELPHRGVDFATFEGDTVIAPGAGMIASIVDDKGFGLSITIVHNERTETFYAHLKSSLVHPGQSVKRGQAIALVGRSGRTSGPHLHYEVHIHGQPVNPENYFLAP